MSSSAARTCRPATCSFSADQPRAAFLLGVRPLGENGLDLRFERGDLGLHLAAQPFRQIVEHVGLDDLALKHRRDGDTGRRAQQRDVLRLGLAAQRFQRILAAEAEFLLDLAPLQVVVVGGECSGQCVGELVDGQRHLFGERLRRPGGQLQRAKAAGGVERADVDPIGRPAGFGAGLLQLGARRRAPARALAADDQHVEAGALYAGAEGKGVHGLRLADRTVRRLEIGRRLEAETGGVSGTGGIRVRADR